MIIHAAKLAHNLLIIKFYPPDLLKILKIFKKKTPTFLGCYFLGMRFANPMAVVGHTRRHKWQPTHFLPTIWGLRSTKVMA